jgi:hypothetical protein
MMNKIEVFDGISNLDLDGYSNTTGNAQQDTICKAQQQMGFSYETCMASFKSAEQQSLQGQTRKANQDTICKAQQQMGFSYETCMASFKSAEQQSLQGQTRKANIDPKELAEIAQLAAAAGVTVASLIQKDPEQKALKNVCGRKPTNKKKREDWEKCAMEFYRTNANTFNNPGRDFNNTPPPPPKGMSTGTKIAIGVGVAAVIGLGIWFVVKKMKK